MASWHKCVFLWFIAVELKLIPKCANFNITERLQWKPSALLFYFVLFSLQIIILPVQTITLAQRNDGKPLYPTFFFSFSQNPPLNDQSFDVDQRAPRSHWVEYVRCYFTEGPIFLLIRWNKHINQKDFKVLDIVFVTVWKLVLSQNFTKRINHI